MHGESIFGELSLIIVLTAVVSILMKLIKQPLILGYILAGLLAGPALLNLIHSTEMFDVFSSIGIALLLFIIGLGMNVNELKKMGRPALIIAGSCLVTMMTVGLAVGTLFNFSKTEAIITGLALFFSSTIIIVKILSDKKEQNRLHGQIAIGVILVDDIVATFALLFVVAGKNGSIDLQEIALLLGKGALLVALLVFCSIKVLPKVSRYMAKTQELLFLSALSWGFGIATLFKVSGFSIEVGALFAGVALASSPYVQEIASRLRPLRDFFIVIFFITLGQSMDISSISSSILPAIILSVLVLILKPITILLAMGILGYTKKVSFKAAIHLSQISEFSIILVILAVNEKVVPEELGGIITMVAIITIAISTYLMLYDEKLYAKFDKIRLRLFERDVKHKERRKSASYEYVLFGYHHGGHEFIRTFKEMKKRFLVVDYDPEVIETLDRKKLNYLYGDATDIELLEEAGIDRSKLIVSTIDDHATNLFLAKLIEKRNPDAAVICHADNIREATELYDAGASYVMIPHHIGSEKMSAFIKRAGANKHEFRKYRQKHLSSLEERLAGPGL